MSLRSITTEMLKVLNATEDLLQGVEGGENTPPPSTSLPPNTDPKKLDQQFSRLEENVSSVSRYSTSHVARLALVLKMQHFNLGFKRIR